MGPDSRIFKIQIVLFIDQRLSFHCWIDHNVLLRKNILNVPPYPIEPLEAVKVPFLKDFKQTLQQLSCIWSIRSETWYVVQIRDVCLSSYCHIC